VYVGLKTLIFEKCVAATRSINLHGDDNLNDKVGETNDRNKEETNVTRGKKTKTM